MLLCEAITSLIARPPKPEEFGTDSIWIDPHVSRNLLAAHLDESTDAASRKLPAREATLEWIEGHAAGRPSARILDLGCGPGLYAEALARAGHSVTGIDFNPASIEYARDSADKKGLAIDYRYGSYLELPYPEGLAAAIMIFCDFGALDDAGRRLVLRKLKASLAPGGLFLFDVCGPRVADSFVPGRKWSAQEGGFWAEGPHLLLEEQFLFSEARSITRQYLVIDGEGRARLFRNHDSWFDEDSLKELLASEGFELAEARRDVLLRTDFGPSEPIFVAARLSR
jgi:2-polyprenyl-3-methyl-5-hydroxy-6-metoxy-1,4-benzoquinol methylase